MKKNIEEFNNIISFVKEIEGLKNNTRTAWTSEGRHESVAEHSWRLAVFALVLEEYYPDIDINKVIRMCLIHDLGEVYEGDVSATIEENQRDKIGREERAMGKLSKMLSKGTGDKLLKLWLEYNKGETRESKIAKAIDKMETIIQHNQGSNPLNFNYEFNLKYGREYSNFDSVVSSLREIIDEETIGKINKLED